MIKGNIEGWKIDASTDGLLYFAQRMNELLYDFTLDSNKYYALNSTSLIKETLSIFEQVQKEFISDKHLEEVVDELNNSVKNDLVVKKVLGDEYSIYLPIKNLEDKDDFRLKLEILSNRITYAINIQTSKEMIIEAVTKNNKRSLDFLINNFTTSCISYGYDSSHMYHVVNEFFFNGDNSISSSERCKEFFDRFDLIKKHYTVVFKVSSSFNEIKETCSKFNVSVRANLLKAQHEIANNQFKSQKEFKDFLTCEKITAMDERSAKNIAESRVKRIANLFTYFHHKTPPLWGEYALVIQNEGRSFHLGELRSPMKKVRDLHIEDAVTIFNYFISNFKLSEKSSFLRFNKVIDLHSLALQNYSTENQILNIWIAFETLLGESKKDSKIQHIIDSLVPVLINKYLEGIIDELIDSLRKWSTDDFDYLIESVRLSTESNTDRITAFIVCKDYDTLREDIKSKLVDFPLLRHRITVLNHKLSSPKKILKYLVRHEERVKWHIRRIYRARNSIVHQGTLSRSSDILVENAHHYLDVFINDFILNNIASKKFMTIEQAVKNHSLIKNHWYKSLGTSTEDSISKETFYKVLNIS